LAELRGAVLEQVNGAPEGAVLAFSSAAWDSEHLGVQVAKVAFVVGPATSQALDAVVSAALASAMQQGHQYLVTRIDAADLPLVQALERQRFQLIDVLLTQYLSVTPFESKLPGAPQASGSLLVRAAGTDDAPMVGKICAESMVSSRFHADPFVGPDRASRVFADWGRNLILGGQADVTLVAEEGGEVAGFLALREVAASRESLGFKYARIELTAVREGSRGRGVFQALFERAREIALHRAWALLGVGTQVNNIAAIRAYQKAGFSAGESAFTLRWLDPKLGGW